MTEQNRIQDKQWSRIVARAWADEEFKGRLISDPKTVLSENGIETAHEVRVCVIEEDRSTEPGDDVDTVLQFILPPNPAGDLLEEDLTPVGVAYCYSGGCHRCGRCGCGCGGCGYCRND